MSYRDVDGNVVDGNGKPLGKPLGKPSELDVFRSRWLRWLGQKTRRDRPTWVTLLNSNWSGWARATLAKHANVESPPDWRQATQERVRSYWRMALLIADRDDLDQLDSLWCESKGE